MSASAWLAPILVPLIAALAVLIFRPVRSWLLVIAPLPALSLGLLGPPGPSPRLPWLLLDASLDLTVAARPLLVMTAAVWAVAGASARQLSRERPSFAALFLLTMAGNVGLLLAGDVVTFYVLFAWMTFAAYGLVVHDRSPAARRAGRVYVVLGVLGEVALLGGLVLAVSHAGDTGMAEVAASLGEAQHRDLIVGLLVAGFGVKAGLVPLHVWLPLAHPAAPVPASAALSGTMIKAGLVGWLQILPLGEVALPRWGTTLIMLGLVGTGLGVVAGTVQSDPKVLLAYSSISQMGLITSVVGVGLLAPASGTLASLAAVTYAVHHGFAKATLFLGVGVHKAGVNARRHRLLIGGMILAALALAGAPLTSGWIAKQLVKDAVDLLPGGAAGQLTLVLSLASVGTTILMARLVWLIREPTRAVSGSWAGFGPWTAGVIVMAVGSWLLPTVVPMPLAPGPFTRSGVWDGLWPVLLGLALSAGWWWLRQRRTASAWSACPPIAPGDLLVVVERSWPLLQAPTQRLFTTIELLERRVRTLQDIGRVGVRPGSRIDRLEDWLTRWRTAGVLFVLIGIAVTLTLGLGTR
jgi:formate hydrogenlyase subunit 3/multisubunit Na+/H+ antiporter MnhD subunit